MADDQPSAHPLLGRTMGKEHTWSSSRTSESWIRRHPLVFSALLGALSWPLMPDEADVELMFSLSSLRDGIGHVQKERQRIQDRAEAL